MTPGPDIDTMHHKAGKALTRMATALPSAATLQYSTVTVALLLRMKRDRWESSSDEEEANNTVDAEEAVTTEQAPAKKACTELALPKHNPLTSGCRSVYDCYERIARLDEGTYGVVWKAKDLGTYGFALLSMTR